MKSPSTPVRFVVALSLISTLCGCVPVLPDEPPPDMPDNQALIAPGIVYTIPPPSALNRTENVSQTIVARFGGTSYQFDVRIVITPERLDMVALDGLGRRAVTLSWSDDTIKQETASWLPHAFRASDVLAAMTMVYWPGEAVMAAFPADKTSVEFTRTHRLITTDEGDLIDIEYGKGTGWNRSAHLDNLVFGYSIDIQSVEDPN